MKSLLPFLMVLALAQPCFSQTWPAGMPPKPLAPNRSDLAPDLATQDLPVNHAKLVWFVSARELVRQGDAELNKPALGKMLDQDIATPTVFSKPQVYEVIFDLQRTILVDRVNFVADNPGCPVKLRVSDADLSRNEGQAWRDVASGTTKVPVTTFDFGMEKVRFIHVSIDTRKAAITAPLNVYEFAVFGQEDLRDYVLRETPEKEVQARERFVESTTGGVYPAEMLQNDLANLDAGSKVLLTSSKAQDPNVSYMIDDDPQTSWAADPSEKETIVLLDLGQERRINRISVMHSSRPGKILAYTIPTLPVSKSAAPKLAWLGEGQTDVPLFRLAQGTPGQGEPKLTAEWLNARTPFGSIDSGKNNFSRFDGDLETSRYVLLRYLNPTPGVDQPLLVNAVNVFGNYGPGDMVLLPRNLPIIAAGGLKVVGRPDSGSVGLSISDQLHAIPDPNAATP